MLAPMSQWRVSALGKFTLDSMRPNNNNAIRAKRVYTKLSSHGGRSGAGIMSAPGAFAIHLYFQAGHWAEHFIQ